jgi:MFS family permease
MTEQDTASCKRAICGFLILVLSLFVGALGMMLVVLCDRVGIGIGVLGIGVLIALFSNFSFEKPYLFMVWYVAVPIALMVWPLAMFFSAGGLTAWQLTRYFYLQAVCVLLAWYFELFLMPACLVSFFVRFYKRERARSKEKE